MPISVGFQYNLLKKYPKGAQSEDLGGYSMVYQSTLILYYAPNLFTLLKPDVSFLHVSLIK